MKKLILRYLKNVDDKVSFKIEEQTHRVYEFGNVDRGDTFIASNGIKFISMSYPDLYTYEDNKTVVCFRGSNEDEDDKNLAVSSVIWKRIKVAVKEYNEFYGYFDECILDDPNEPIKDIVPKEMFIIDIKGE